MKLFQKSLCVSLVFTIVILSFNTGGLFFASKKLSKCWQSECLNLENKIGPDFTVAPLTGRLSSHSGSAESYSCSQLTADPLSIVNASQKEILASGWKAKATFGSAKSVIIMEQFSTWAKVESHNPLVSDDAQTAVHRSLSERYLSQNIFVPIHPPQSIYSF